MVAESAMARVILVPSRWSCSRLRMSDRVHADVLNAIPRFLDEFLPRMRRTLLAVANAAVAHETKKN
jgi:hypothetical protein